MSPERGLVDQVITNREAATLPKERYHSRKDGIVFNQYRTGSNRTEQRMALFTLVRGFAKLALVEGEMHTGQPIVSSLQP